MPTNKQGGLTRYAAVYVPAVVLLFIWILLTRTGAVNPVFLPSPGKRSSASSEC